MPVMIRDKDYPQGADTIIRSLRALGYMFGAVVGLALLTVYNNPSGVSILVLNIVGGMLLFSGLFATISTVLKRWMLEWIALTGILFGIAVYLVAIWSRVGDNLSNLAGAGAITMLWLLCGIRFIDLTVFYHRYMRLSLIRNRVVDSADND